MSQVRSQPPIEPLGLYRTAEGQRILRDIYPIFLKVRKIGNGKAMTPIFEASESRVVSASADRESKAKKLAAKAAIRRWVKDGQPLLWRDKKRSEWALAKLEAEMMDVPEIRLLLEERADSTRKRQMGNAFAQFYFGAGHKGAKSAETLALKSRILGLHQIYEPYTDPDPHPADVVLTTLTTDHWFIRFDEVPGEPFLIVHTFKFAFLWRATEELRLSKESGSEGPSGIRSRRSGFGYPLPSGEVHCLMADYGPPGLRTYVILKPTEMENLHLWRHSPLEPTDNAFLYSEVPRYPFRQNVESPGGPTLSANYKVLRRAGSLEERAIDTKLEKLTWSIVI